MSALIVGWLICALPTQTAEIPPDPPAAPPATSMRLHISEELGETPPPVRPLNGYEEALPSRFNKADVQPLSTRQMVGALMLGAGGVSMYVGLFVLARADYEKQSAFTRQEFASAHRYQVVGAAMVGGGAALVISGFMLRVAGRRAPTVGVTPMSHGGEVVARFCL